jgi:para-nitrobenzyl esterase
LIAGAIGESGALISTLPPRPLAEAEADGTKFAAGAGAPSLAALRAMSAQQLQEATTKVQGVRFSTVLDGYFLSKLLPAIFEAGGQARIPLLAGSNTEEQGARSVLGTAEPTPENFVAAVKKLYGDNAAEVLKAYAPTTTEEVPDAAMELASARFIAYGTWKWTELHMKTGGKPVYRYLYAHPRPRFLGNAATPAPSPGAGRGGQAPTAAAATGRGPATPAAPRGAAHSAEIQYAMGNLKLDDRYAWEPADFKVSETMQAYFVNFIKTGNPNGKGMPEWPSYTAAGNYQIMKIDVESKAMPQPHRDRYLALDAIAAKQ